MAITPAPGSSPPSLSLDTSLSEFQRQLDAAIAAPDVSTDAFVGMVVDDQRWLLDLSMLSETSVPPPVSRTGRAPEWVLGIASFRGQVYTVMDMRYVLKKESTLAISQAWATPLHNRWGGSIALLWPQMAGLLGKQELKALPADILLPRWAKASWKDAQGQTWHEFDVASFTRSEYAGNAAPERNANG